MSEDARNELKEARAAAVEAYNEAAQADEKTGLEAARSAINEIDVKIDALYAKALDEKRTAEAALKLKEIEESRGLADVGEESVTEVRDRAILSTPHSVESRATLEIPTVFDTQEKVGDAPIVLSNYRKWWNRVNFENVPFRDLTEKVHYIDDVAFSAGTEAVTVTPSDPTNQVQPDFISDRKDLSTTVSFERLKWDRNVQAKIMQRIKKAQNVSIEAEVNTALNAVTATGSTAASLALSIDDLLALQAEVDVEVQDRGIWLLSQAAYVDIQQAKGSDNYHYDHKSQWDVLAGSPAFKAPGLAAGGTTAVAGETAAVYLLPEVLRVGVSNTELRIDDSVGVKELVRTYVAAFYSGAVVQDATYAPNIEFLA